MLVWWGILAALLAVDRGFSQAIVEKLHAFGYADTAIAQPSSALVEDANGVLYGTSLTGGRYGFGTVFRILRDGTGLKVIYHFGFGQSTTNPTAPIHVIEGSDGVLYGLSQDAATSPYGTVFRVNKDGSGFAVLHSFKGSMEEDGRLPTSLIEGSDGWLYGATESGGWQSLGGGTLFRLRKDGSGYSVTFRFSTQSGINPTPGLHEGSDGWLYGATRSWGDNYAGTVFKVRPDGTAFTVLRHFSTLYTEANGPSYIMCGRDGGLYGTTEYMGMLLKGTVFKLQPDGQGYAVLYSFKGGTNDGQVPMRLMESRDGMLYGITKSGGLGANSGNGTLFRMRKDGTGYQVLRLFAAWPNDGRAPMACPLEGSDGMIYGSLSEGGAASDGVLYRVEKNGGDYTVINICRRAGGDGMYPQGGLVEDAGGWLYGVSGGGSNGYGTVYKIARDGSAYVPLHQFTKLTNDGGTPMGGLLLASDGALYGATTYGGGSNKFGTVFKIGRDGAGFALVHGFTNSTLEGSSPESSLMEATNGAIYGTTRLGGASNLGAIFRMDKDGRGFSVLHSFAGSPVDGEEPFISPVAGLVEVEGGILFGSTGAGGISNKGTLFLMRQDGSGYTVLHHFTGSDGDGGTPNELMRGRDGNLYGSTRNPGTVFAINPLGGAYRVLCQVTNGSPWARLGEGADGTLYGNTLSPGGIFKVNRDGTGYAFVHQFGGARDGVGEPYAGLLLGSDGALYGTATGGGEVFMGGTVYRMPLWLAAPADQKVWPGTNVCLTAWASGTTPPTYQWRKNGTELLNETNPVLILTNVGVSDRGLYSVVISNSVGVVVSSNVMLRVMVPQRWGTPVRTADGRLMLPAAFEEGGGVIAGYERGFFQLQVSTNLSTTNWRALDYAFMLSNGTLIYIENTPSNAPQRFYRILER